MFVHIFDCDGVISDTNEIKSDAFKYVARKYLSNEALIKLIEFHENNIGKSRWEKFNFLKVNGLNDEFETDFLCQEYAFYVENYMYKKPLVPYIKKYINSLEKNSENIIYIASGGESNQVKRLIKFHKINIMENNIFGSPTKKIDIVKTIKKKHVKSKFILYGDSLYDSKCAALIEAKFIFISGYTNCEAKAISKNYPIALEIRDFEEFSFSKIKNIF